MRDMPSAAALLTLGREYLLDEVLPLLPMDMQRDLRLVATVMAMAARELDAADPALNDIRTDLARLAADLRIGAFETCEQRSRAARAILWRLTISKLREANPSFLAANGCGE